MLFGSGKIVKDYRLLNRYFELLDSRNIDKSNLMPTSSDIETIVSIAMKGSANLLQIINTLVNRLKPKIYGDIAREAFRDVYGIDVDESTAIDRIAMDMAGWVIEIAEALGLIRIVGNLPKE